MNLAKLFPKTVLIVLLDSPSTSIKDVSSIKIPIDKSHRPEYISRHLLNNLKVSSSKVVMLPNNSACAYEAARKLQTCLQSMNVDSLIIGIIHSNTRASLELVIRNSFMLSKLYAVTNAIKEAVQSMFQRDFGCDVLHYPTHLKLKSPKRVRPSEPGELLKLLYVGRLVEDQKRFSRVLNLILLLRSAGIGFRLEVIGDGHLIDKLKAVAQSHPTPERDVVLRGEQPHEVVETTMSHSDILILTSDFEGLPLVLMEAMSLGTVPVVMNYGPEVTELVTHGEDGYVVGQGRVDEMAEMLGLLASDRKKLRELSENALVKASEFMSFNSWRDEICRPTPKRFKREEHRNSSYVETRKRVERGVKTLQLDSKLIIWGGGHIGRLIIDELISNKHELKGCVVIDRVLYKYLPMYRDVPYHSSENLPEEEFDKAIIASEYYAAEIQATLEDFKRRHNPTLHITAVRDWR